ncbi:Imm8 family immunity protein [Nocardia sp. NPDC052001]|uniref:Imm8 family immunity protein n=1 Tax=Nocardia sp. NPDC052001 TaxID=3154853 RepID=UPI0034416C10
MRAELKGLHSPDPEPTAASPLEQRDTLFVQLLIGPAGEPGEESFGIMVCTPKGLQRLVDEHGPISGRHYLFVESIDLGFIQKHVENFLGRLDEPSWPELAGKVARFGHWEFEDYNA